MSKQSKEFIKRKKQSDWHWDYWDDRQDNHMFKFVGNIKGKWPKIPKRNESNKMESTNPSVIAQQGHYGITTKQIFSAMWLRDKDMKKYERFITPLGLENPVAYIHTQNPGQMTVIHMDTARANNIHLDKNGKPLTEKQRRQRIARLFIMLDDWKPGQIMLMGSRHCVRWKKGDIIYFSWQHLPHGTANFGHDPRPMLFIQGEVTEKFKKILNNKKKITIKA
tara:strand:- start:1917 stop:2582 length:666 start_codon:yes stop_codon:yes gene_type:complete